MSETRLAIVTGASRGIGAAIALALGRQGRHVVLMARDATKLGEVAAQITAAGGKASVKTCDVSDHKLLAEMIEAIADDVPRGEVTDFYRAVKAEDGETVVFSFIEWPDKQARDDAWAKIMSDESLKPEGDMPFSGQRMFWGGFDKIVDSTEQQARQPQAPISA